MKNLFCQVIDFFTGRVINEETAAKKIDTASSELLVYRKGDNICFASRISVYSIPVSSIKKTYINDKMEYYDGWNKEDFEYDEVYKDSIYIERNRYWQVLRKFMKNSYHIEIELNGEMYEIIVPKYDFRSFEQIYREI